MSNYYPFNYYNNNNNLNNSNSNDIYNSDFYETRFVYCPIWGKQSHIKPTKTHRLMLRCDSCRALIFANAEMSQRYLLDLPEYREYY
jgi:hypothetical protein